MILTATLLLLAGAVVNVAVAWGIAAIARPVDRVQWGFTHETTFMPASDSEGGQILDTLVSGWPLRTVGCTSYRTDYIMLSNGPLLPDVLMPTAPSKEVGRHASMRYGAGVSLGSLASRERLFAASGGRLPVEPIPAGFAINTLLYATILALPLSFFPIRRRLRTRRGRCPTCGYDLAGLAASCPECGATATHPPGARASSPHSAAGRSEGTQS